MIQEVKLTYRSERGTLLKSPATLEYKEGRIYFLKSPFALKNEIKAMQGSKWHGFEEKNPRKMWSVKDTQRNRFQIGFLAGEDVYAWFDRDIVNHVYERPLHAHQKDLADHFLTYHYGIMAAEMGCVDGNAIVRVNRGGRGFSLTLRELCYKFHGGVTSWKKINIEPVGRVWDLDIPTYIRGYKGDRLGLIRVKDVLFKGVKKVLQLSIAGGVTLKVTNDHLICVSSEGYGEYKRADELKVGDSVMLDCRYGYRFVKLKSIVKAGAVDVYDVVCEGPYHNFAANGVIVHNCGKTLAAQEVMERSGIKDWFWIGPKPSLPNIKREFRKWNLDPSINVEMLNFEALVRVMNEWTATDTVPQGLIIDEASRCKGETSQRSLAVQDLADRIRATYGFDGFVIEMSGTPAPKRPTDWWRVCEIAWPGFLREGSVKAMEARLAFMVDAQYDAGVFKQRIGWKDDEKKCRYCGGYEEDEHEDHVYEPSINEVAYLHERLKGLVIVKHKKDCLDLPDKQYRVVQCKPTSSIKRVAEAISKSAPNAITALTLLRELSDGFQYKEVQDGETTCTYCKDGNIDEWFDPQGEDRVYKAVDMLDQAIVGRLEKRRVPCPQCGGTRTVPKMVRTSREVTCPKDEALRDLLDECEETGRIVVWAGFTGSIDRAVKVCQKEGWDIVRCDGRGYHVLKHDGTVVTDEEPLDYWANKDHARVAFVSNAETGGMSLTLVESRMAVYWSNSFKPDYRIQSEDRIHRIGMDTNKGCLIVDLIHLPTDQRVLDVIRDNRRLELMTLGEVMQGINWEDAS